jgi:hypothetical protein
MFAANIDYPKMKDMYKKRWKAVMMTDKNTYEAVTPPGGQTSEVALCWGLGASQGCGLLLLNLGEFADGSTAPLAAIKCI